jgi:hypothetical protein
MLRLSMKKAVLAVALLAIVSLVQAEKFNGTTYRLSLDQMEVIRPINGSSFNLTLHEKAIDIGFQSSDGLMIGVNNSYSFWGGNHNYRITFDQRVAGDLVYTVPYHSQQLILPLMESSPVRVILPPGYTTGDRILGIARPDPDQIITDKNGTILTWNNPGQILDVGYYKENAPDSLKKIFALIVAMAAILLLEYYASIRRLRAISKESEKGV